MTSRRIRPGVVPSIAISPPPIEHLNSRFGKASDNKDYYDACSLANASPANSMSVRFRREEQTRELILPDGIKRTPSESHHCDR